MSRKHKPQASQVDTNAAQNAVEAREQTDGFEFPLGVASGQETPIKYFCCAIGCPGYDYAPNDRAHPVGTCGTLMNSLPREQKAAEMMQESREAAATLEETGFSGERLSGIFTEGTSESQSDDPPVEVHTDVEASDHPIAAETTPELPPLPKDARFECSVLGKFLEQDNGTWTEVVGKDADDFVWLCEFQQKEDFGSWTLIHRSLRPWIQTLSFVGIKRIVEIACVPDWVLNLRSKRLAAFDEGIIGTSSEEPQLGTELRESEPYDTQMALVLQHCVEIATELNLDVEHVIRYADSILQLVAQVVTVKELTATTPLIPAFLDHLVSPQMREKTKSLIGVVVDGPIRETITKAAQASVDDFEAKLADLTEQLGAVGPDAAQGHNEDDSELVPMLRELEKFVKTSSDQQERALGDLDHRIAILSSKVDTINEDLGAVEEHLDDRSPGWKPDKKGKKPRAKATPKVEKVPEASPFDDDEEEIVDLDDEDDDDDEDDLDDLDDEEFDDPDQAVDAVAAQKRAAAAEKAKAKAPKRGRGRPRKEPIPVPTKGMVGRRPKGKVKKARGRAAIVQRERALERDNTPMGKTPPNSVNLREIDKFMGRKKNHKIRSMLARVPAAKLGKFLEKTKKGIHDMNVTGWDIKEQSAFIRWFFGR